jgi:iron complex outermembrane receptor protein
MRNVEFEMKDWGTKTNSTFLIPNSTLRTQLTGPQKSLLLAMLAILLAAQTPLPGYTEELPTKSKQAVIPELELIKEEETVSIASRYEQPISKAPANVYVITDEDIRQSGATDIPTVLRRIPGMEVMQMNGAEFNVSMRGNNQLFSNKLLVLVDGRSIYVDALGFMFWKMLPVTLPEIKKIEVLKGPASAIYGFNAFDGIINIITKSPEEMKGTTMQVGGGEFGTISSAAIHANKIGAFGYRLSVGRDQNQQWRDRDALAFRSNKFNLQTEYALSSLSKLTLSGGLVSTNRFDGLTRDLVNTAVAAELGYAHVTYERPNFFVRGFWNGISDTSRLFSNPLLGTLVTQTDRDGNTSGKIRTNTYNIEAQHTLDVGNSHLITYGINYRHNSVSNQFITEFTREDRVGLYLQDEWKATPSLSLVMGARYDLNTFVNPTISPRVAVLYEAAQDHVFRLSGSVAYRPPTIIETKADFRGVINLPPPTPSPPPAVLQGSDNLKAEQIVSYEAGYQGWFLNHRLRARASLFFNHLSELVSPTPASLINSGKADIYGGDAGIEFFATPWLSGFANFSYQEIGQSFAGAANRGAPRFKYNMGLRGDWDNGWSGEAALHHVGAATYPIDATYSALAQFGASVPPSRVDSYNLLNLRVAYKFWQEKAEAGYIRDAEVALSAYNALNDMHKEHPLGDTIGSRVMGWITVRY